jgi:hypothetical protein
MQRVLDKSDADVVTRKPSRAAAIKIEVFWNSTQLFWHPIEQGCVSKLQTQRFRPLQQLELWDFMSFSLCLLRTGIVLHSRTNVETTRGDCAGMVVHHCG